MGVGKPTDIIGAVARGVDMFDCVLPTRNARHGLLYTSEGIINIRNEKWKNDFSVIDPNGLSFVDAQYTRAYLRHLVVCNEILAAQIASVHNLAFFVWLMEQAREQIIMGTFADWKNKMVKKLGQKL